MPLKALSTLLGLGCAVLLLTGCWDRVEINDRGFVVGVAVDYKEAGEKNLYTGTFQMMVPGGLKQSNTQNNSAPHATQAYFNISTSENSMPAIAARMAAKTSRTPYFEHLKVIIVSSEVAKSKAAFPSMLDYFLRNSEMRRGVQVLIAEGKASDILDIEPNNETTPIDYISSIAKNNKKTNYMLPQSRIGDVHESLIKRESYVIQKVKRENKDLSLNGSALFDGATNQLVGFLNGEETQGLNFITKGVKGGIVEANFGDEIIGFKVERARRKFIVKQTSPDHFKFTIKLVAEGVLDKSLTDGDPTESKTLESLQKKLEETLIKNSNKVIAKLQKTYKKDALGLGAYLFENHYKMWKPISENWDTGSNLFSQTEVEVQAQVIIRRVGNIFEVSKER
ncbi:Ger(x)C family spore germination protein [Paenibacillus alba]|uniref:Ger(x)C family spore germination protein n=1 Tax=Paenibacillus alba TaxID=1197127 RepID=UPI001564554A|nr:Ger(x)C family spore germination protein [Paenibacillus alba]NQX65336.1 Ger(x)C family spore germination protein [Paenibacillus alba]